MKPTPQNLLVFLLGVLLSSSCGTPADLRNPTPTSLVAPESSPTPIVTNTPRSIPSTRPDTNLVQTLSAVPTNTPFDDELAFTHPLSIEYMRKGKYPGSAITFEQELDKGSNYGRYYVSYQSEGLKIYALMTIPNGEPPEDGWPAIIFNHGYIPPALYVTTERYANYVDQLARNGYIVFRSDYRGHDRSEGESRGAYGYPDYTIDVLNALASVKSYPEANPDRIGMWGHSMGGYLTLRCMVISNDIKVGVIWAGVVAPYSDLVYEWPEQEYEVPEIANQWRTALPETYGTPSENPAFWDAISANSYLTQLSGPIQLQHGTGDRQVPVGFSTSLYQQLTDLDIPVELYTYQNDDHNLTNSFDVAMRRTIQTFNIYLK